MHSFPLHRTRWRFAGWGLAATLLLVPLVAMQFSDAWQWDGFDFAVAAALLGSAGLALEWVMRNSVDRAYRCGMVLAIAGSFLLLWLNAAVGLIGADRDPANQVVPLVPLLGLTVALLGRWRVPAMVQALLTMSLAQALLAALVQLFGGAGNHAQQPAKLLLPSALFAVLWLVSAAMVGRAVHRRDPGAD